MRQFLAGCILAGLQCLSPATASAQTPLTITTLAEKKVADLTPGPLFWRIDNFAAREQAQAEVVPIPRIDATQYLRRINEASGTTELHALVMFVVDATQPFSSPATLP